INKDGKVNAEDLNILISCFHGTLSEKYDTDMNEDGKTAITDLILMKDRLTGTQYSVDTSN
ncbi:MAG: hypothetical protein IKM72_03360, partial [Oscillospiraceae bacterium]|nr:hypothetical protein [Oscillospiraceae bacterium]